MKISRKILIEELLEKCPESAEVLMDHGLHCIGCMASRFETLEDGCKAHGFDDKEIDEIVEDIKKKIKKS